MGKSRKPKPLRTKRGEYFRHVENQILEYTIKCENIKTAQNNLMANCQKQGKITGVSYDDEKVRNSSKQLTLIEAVRKIDVIQSELESCLSKLKLLEEERKLLINLYNESDDIKNRVFFYREIMGYTQDETAKTLGYSLRQIQRIEKKIISES